MADVFKLIDEFNRDLVGYPRPKWPARLTPERKAFGLGFLREEVQEYEDAETIEDEIDALIDLIYVAGGRLYEMGVDSTAHFLEVDGCNKRKVRGTKSTRLDSEGYDTVKPKGWKGPDHTRVLMETDPHWPIDAEPDAPANRVINGDMVIDQREEGHVPKVWRRRPPKVLLLGYARHGKDTVAEIMRDEYGLSFTSSSMFCAERIVRPYMEKHLRLSYDSAQSCFDDRVNWRSVWYDAIKDYNRLDPARLGREIAEEHDIYVGLRSKRELHAVRNAGVFDVIIWVDATDRLPPEPSSSCSVEAWMADFVIDNNEGLSELRTEVRRLMDPLSIHPQSLDFAKAA